MKIINIIIILITVPVVVFGATSNYTVSNDVFTVEVNGGGNVPKYTYYTKSEPSEIYKIQYYQLYECEGTYLSCTKVPESTIALASLEWDFLDPTEDTSEFLFTMVGTGSDRFTSLRIDNHLSKSENKTSVKFDVTLEEYKWISNDTSNNIVIRFTMEDDTSKGVFTTEPLGEYTELESTTKGPVLATLMSRESGAKRDLTYSKFPYRATLSHDPTFGVSLAPGSFMVPWLTLLFLILCYL